MFFYFFLFASPASGKKLEAEVARDVSVDVCSHLPTYSHANMNFFHQPVQLCVTIRSNKGKKEEMRDLQSTTSLQAQVSISWRQLATATSCKLVFKGYQSEYRISPDMGGYEACQNSVSRHLFILSQAMNINKQTQVAVFNASNENCPIRSLPSTYTEYVTCKFTSNEWYLLEWKSRIRYETFRNGEYGTFWANETASFVVQATRELRRNGTELQWLQRLLNVHAKQDGCDRADVLLRFGDGWPLRSNAVGVTYVVRDGSLRLHVQHVVTVRVDPWAQVSVRLEPIVGVHEVCAQMISPLFSRQSVCTRIVDTVDCPFAPTTSSVAPSSAPSLLLLIFVVLSSFAPL